MPLKIWNTALTPRRPSRVAMPFLACALLALPAIGRAQDLAALERVTAAQHFLDLIQSTEAESGIYDPALVEPLVSLAAEYRGQNRFADAAATLTRARQILRVNQGLGTLEEVRVLDELVRTAEAQEDVVQTREFEQSLLNVAQQHLGAQQTYTVFKSLADKRMRLLGQYLAGKRPPQIYAGCYYAKSIDYNALGSGIRPPLKTPGSNAECTSGDRPVVQRALLIEAITYQGWALEALLQNGAYASDEMLALMSGFFRSSDQLHRLMSRGSEYFIAPVWNRVLGYEAQSPDERVRQAQMQLLLADLNLLRLGREIYFDDYEVLYQQYRLVQQRLSEEGANAESLQQLFAPALPVRLPVHQPNPFVAVEEIDQGAWVDVRFDIDERGKSRRVRVVGMTEGITRAESREVERLIRESRFRPKLVDGIAMKREEVLVRYPVDAGDARRERPATTVNGIALY